MKQFIRLGDLKPGDKFYLGFNVEKPNGEFDKRLKGGKIRVKIYDTSLIEFWLFSWNPSRRVLIDKK